ncbi:MAG TPA: flagellar biosynthetic protein FliO [Clostridia bacterium]|nr:flagellar biosynthetic protein FliO [Clostridia bacterium]
MGVEAKVLLYFIGFCSVLYLAYIATKYIANKQSKAMKSKNISVVETVMLSPDKRLHLIKAGKSYALIATTSKTVEFLTTVELDEEAVQETVPVENGFSFDFKSIFEKYSGLYGSKKDKNSAVTENEAPQNISEGHDFRTNLGKLKSIVGSNKYKVKENGDDVTNEK